MLTAGGMRGRQRSCFFFRMIFGPPLRHLSLNDKQSRRDGPGRETLAETERAYAVTMDELAHAGAWHSRSA